MKKLVLPILCFVSIVTTACSVDVNGKDRSVNENGISFNISNADKASDKIINQTRNVGKFDGLNISSALEVEVTDNASNGAITITGSENVVNLVKADVVNGILVLKITENVQDNYSKIKITIPHQKIRSLKISGASSFNVHHVMKVENFTANISGASTVNTNLMANQLNLNISGASKVDFAGNSQHLKGEISGAAKVNLNNLKASVADLKISGASKVNLWAVNRLDIVVSGASKVMYKNVTSLTKNINTSGASNVNSYD